MSLQEGIGTVEDFQQSELVAKRKYCANRGRYCIDCGYDHLSCPNHSQKINKQEEVN